MDELPQEALLAGLEAELRNIPLLTVHGVGIDTRDGGSFVVYCRAKRHAEKRIPKKHGRYPVRYVLGKFAPAGLSR